MRLDDVVIELSRTWHDGLSNGADAIGTKNNE